MFPAIVLYSYVPLQYGTKPFHNKSVSEQMLQLQLTHGRFGDSGTEKIL